MKYEVISTGKLLDLDITTRQVLINHYSKYKRYSENADNSEQMLVYEEFLLGFETALITLGYKIIEVEHLERGAS